MVKLVDMGGGDFVSHTVTEVHDNNQIIAAGCAIKTGAATSARELDFVILDSVGRVVDAASTSFTIPNSEIFAAIKKNSTFGSTSLIVENNPIICIFLRTSLSLPILKDFKVTFGIEGKTQGDIFTSSFMIISEINDELNFG